MAVADIPALPTRQALDRPKVATILFAIAILLAVAKPLLPDFLIRVPEAAVLPYQDWLQWFFDFVKDDLGLIHVTRGISSVLEWLLDITANLLYGKHRWPYVGPIPWTAIAAVATVIGYALSGWRMAALAGGTFVWVALIGNLRWRRCRSSLSRPRSRSCSV